MREFLKEELQKLKENYLYRERILLPEEIINFSSNDYLGLRKNKKTKKHICSNINNLDLGSGASPLVSGYHKIQKELEKELSKLKQTEDCIVVGSGYLANIGLIQALADENTIIFSDELNHASIIDGIRLSKAEKEIYKHNDIKDLENKLKKYKNSNKRKIVITDGVFSMEGDIANIPEIYKLQDRYDFILIIDDAHGTGVIGEGKGTIFHYNLKPRENTIQMGTLSKAIGSYGAFICGIKELIEYLTNKMRTGIFSTALSPIQNYISLQNLKIAMAEPQRREKIHRLSEYLATELKKLGFNIKYFNTPILSLILGSEKKALQYRDLLLKENIFIQAIRPPTIPKGTSRLRITITYNNTEEQIETIVKALYQIKTKE